VEAERRKAQEEADRIRREAEQRELARLAEEKRKAEEESRRAADVEHRRGINSAAVQALINQGIPHEWAKACIIAVALGKVPATTIKY
jgi:membrane protein involved in colicin uptake